MVAITYMAVAVLTYGVGVAMVFRNESAYRAERLGAVWFVDVPEEPYLMAAALPLFPAALWPITLGVLIVAKIASR